MPDFLISDYMAMGALIVSIISAAYTKSQSRSAALSRHNDYRAHLAEHHQIYLEALRASRQAHKANLTELANLARSTLSEIVEFVDNFDIQRSSGTWQRPLRHVLHECAEIVFYALKGQLAWQSGLNISSRLYQISRVEFDLEPTQKGFLGPNFRQAFEWQYLKEPNTYQECMLTHDPYFCDLVEQLRSRIDPSRSTEWTSLLQQKLAPFVALHKSKSDLLKAEAESLEEIIAEGKVQHFSLTESPILYASLKKQQTTLETLSSILLPRISERDAHHYSNYASISLTICATMFVVANSDNWGWEK
ncbi:hypothetical protein L1889_10330 [Paenalcaligenes niemegkensis]|uniref:hypothetical protein n=1 Tax=Paenalcaligenes niemegkensis TaxID=2895469 RepID=UPI001EE88D44|nr:hypothetical protein [Paenalcaligenes niemegkensis]MCQ9617050.1 hypothetical protein [Paenalcaligenes niemegkensis]